MDKNHKNSVEPMIKKRKVVSSRIKWTDEMEKEIFEFSRNSLADGRGFEKPTANEFYRRFLASASPVNFANVTLEKVVQHMKAIKTAYSVAINWRNQTGQGILAADPNSGEVIKQELTKRCKQFDEIDDIIGDRPQFNPPYIHHSDTVASDTVTNDTGGEDIFHDEGSHLEEDLDSIELTSPGVSETTFTGSEVSVAEVKNHQPFKKSRTNPVQNAVGALESAMKLRAQAEEKRLEWESKCKENEMEERKQERAAQFNLEAARLEFEKKKWQEEIQLKTDEKNKKYELEKLKLEKESQLAQERLKHEFEIEKMKLNMGIVPN